MLRMTRISRIGTGLDFVTRAFEVTAVFHVSVDPHARCSEVNFVARDVFDVNTLLSLNRKALLLSLL